MSNIIRSNSNYVSDILDEIALEGLDGITLEALWMRLSVRPNFGIKIDEYSKLFLWGVISRMKDITFYELPEARPSLRYFDYLITSETQNAILELDEIYPYYSLKDLPEVLGSCQQYFTRIDITLEVIRTPLEEVEVKWGNKLTIVASQESRINALQGNFCPPNLEFSKNVISYDMLERIGRARYLGLNTNGKGSLQSVVEDPKSIFHYLKFLHGNKLVKKQSLLGSLEKNTNFTKIYLTRFYNEGLTENSTILQTAFDELKSRPNFMMPADEFYGLFDVKMKGRVKKYKKSAVFKKYITILKNVPYRTVYPNASQAEWERKSKNGERVVRCFQLINPYVDLNESYDKDCDMDDEEGDSGFLPRGVYYKNMPIFAQAYYHVKNSGGVGMTHTELQHKMGLNKSVIRGLIKRLTSDRLCKFFIENDGRRRSKRYIVGENAQNKAAASEITKLLSGNQSVPKPSNKTDGKEKKGESNSGLGSDNINLTRFQDENVSYRALKRIALVIKTIKAHKFRFKHQITKYVNEEEMKEGITTKVDRVTILRILQKLEKDGIIKTITLGGQNTGGQTLKLYAEPSFELDDKLGETIYHTVSCTTPEKFKSCDEGQNEFEKEFSSTVIENLKEVKKMMEDVVKKPEQAREEESKDELAYSPKFMRLNILHDLLFHLVYDYTGILGRSQEELLDELSKTTAIDEDLRKEMPKLYGTQTSMYMFVPPLKKTVVEKLPGWFLVSDILLRMPLSVMVKVIRVPEACADLWKYLHHPVRKHFLLKDLPLSIRQLFFNRKHQLDAMYYDLKRLAYIGVLQYGVKFGKEFYHTSLYLNRKASLLDTTSSSPSYYHISPKVNYETKTYYFRTKTDVKKYWMDMFNICMGTNLGVKSSMIGKEILTEREMCKESLKKYAEPKPFDQVLQDDNGKIPGDNLGAAGLDSVMFSFLRGNWTTPISKTRELPKDKKNRKIPMLKLKGEPITRKIYLRHNSNKKETPTTDSSEDLQVESPKGAKLRKVKERVNKIKKRKQASYDEDDMEALKLMNTLRVSWSTAEDNFLLICKVALLFLCPNPRSFFRIPWAEVRKVLQRNIPESRDKTQRAICRRIKYMLKNPTTARSVTLCLEELKGMPEAVEMFDCSELHDKIKPSTPNLAELQERLYEKFHDLVLFLKNSFINDDKRKDQESIPDSLEEFLEKYQLETESEETPQVKDIRENVVRAILMSSLSCKADKTSSAVQLFDIYRQYDDDELQNAVKKLNEDKVITTSKKAPNTMFKDGKIIPLTFSPYKFSFAFKHSLNMKYSQHIYHDSFLHLEKLLQYEQDEEFEVELHDSNTALFLLASKYLVSFIVTLPEQIIVIDSGDLSDSAYSKMVDRYCEILRLNKDNSKVVCTSGVVITKPEDGETLKEKKRLHSECEEDMTKKQKVENKNSVGVENQVNEEKEKNGEEQELANEKTNRSSRVILYIMREEAKKNADGESAKIALESCVVNASKIMSSVDKENLQMYFNEMEPKVASTIAKNIVSRCLVPMNLIDENSALKSFTSEKEISLAKSILCFLDGRHETGATVQELKSKCKPEMLASILRSLMESKIIIKTGMKETRFVSQKYSSPWLLRSFKMTRLEREKVKPNELSAVAIFGEDDDEPQVKRKKGVISSEDLKSQDYAPPTCSFDENNKIQIILRPWLRIDGTLNRKVLDRFLGTILSFIMSNPGVSIEDVKKKFSPSMTPVWTKDLVEILYEIGCLTITTLTIKKESTLFSESEVEVSSVYTSVEDDKCVLVEAKIDAIITLGLFIGKKAYSKDFLVK